MSYYTQQHQRDAIIANHESPRYEDLIPISIIANRALIFDLEDIKKLREECNILGVLSGTLPIAPQQSIFLSVPLQLSAEEVLYLVRLKKGYLVHDRLVFSQLFDNFSTEDKERYLNDQWQEIVKYIKQLKLEIEETKRQMIAKSKQKKKNKKANEGHENGADTQQDILANINMSQSSNQHCLMNNENQEITAKDFRLIFHEIQDHSKNFPNYEWLVDTLQRHPETQKWLLYNFVRNHLINKSNDVTFSKKNGENLTHTYKSITNPPQLDSNNTTTDAILEFYDRHINLKHWKQKLYQLQTSVNFIHSLHSHPNYKNYYVAPGLKFGSKFIVYPGDPLRYHSHLMVNFHEYYNEGLDLMEIVNGGRLAVGVKKVWVISGDKLVKDIQSHDDIKDSSDGGKRSSGKQSDESEAAQVQTDIEKFVENLTSSSGGSSQSSEIVSFSVEWAGFG